MTAVSVIYTAVNNPNFLNSLQNTGTVNYTFSLNSITEGLVRIKEVITFYYFYGLWYYMVDPIIQSIFKKVIFVIIAIAIALVFAKKHKTLFLVVALLGLLLTSGFILEKLGLYPFEGRHIMPFSIFLYILIANLLSFLYLL